MIRNETASPVIVIAFNGTNDPRGQQELAGIDAGLRERFPENEIRWALTSPWMIRHLQAIKQREIFPPPPGRAPEPVQNLSELYGKLAAERKNNAVVLCLMVHECGASIDVYDTPSKGLNVGFVRPIMCGEHNVDTLLKAVAPRFGGPGTVNILVGHGNLKRFDLNDSFVHMAQYARQHYDNVFMATLHGPPGTETAFNDARQLSVRETIFIPLTIINGGHISSDVMADTATSWKNQIGLPARVESSLSKNPEVIDIFLNGIDQALRELPQASQTSGGGL